MRTLADAASREAYCEGLPLEGKHVPLLSSIAMEE
jgi:hypothetical protein